LQALHRPLGKFELTGAIAPVVTPAVAIVALLAEILNAISAGRRFGQARAMLA
jgi:hypothetical protein